MIQVSHLLGNLQGGQRFDTLLAGRSRWLQNKLQVPSPRLQILAAEQAQQLGRCPVLCR